MDKPHEIHWIATKSVLRYLKGTINFGIEYTNDCHVELTCHSDFDWPEIQMTRNPSLGKCSI